jgi:hypothetical protein
MIAKLILLLLIAMPAMAQDPRFCGSPARDANGEIVRSSAERAAFQRLYACPANGLKRGACPGWEVDHVIPLACGGCDAVANMQWLPSGAKSTSSPLAKDRWERRVYCDAARAN